ncbi:MAG: LytTR family DNA-binding domain-containing protein [Bacteroidota bacterium]
MRTIIIDDERPVRENLRQMLERFCPKVEIIAEADSVYTGREAILTHLPDLVMLDVELEDGTGMDLLSSLASVDFYLIFVTAHFHYAVQAFRFSAIDYLLKPIAPDLLQEAVQKVQKTRQAEHIQQQLQTLLDNLNAYPNKPEKVVVKDLERNYVLEVENIAYIKAEGSYSRIFLIDQPAILVSMNLKAQEKLFKNHDFLKCHHSYLVNLQRIKYYDKKNGGFLILSDGTELPVATRRKDQLLGALKRL